jgi:protein-disulfide isomerase
MSDEKKVNKTLKWCKKNVFVIVSIVLAIGLILSLIPFGNLTKAQAGNEMVEFLNTKTGGGVTLLAVESQGSLYEVTVNYQDQEIPVFMTKDGDYFIQGAERITMTGQAVAPQTNTQPVDIPKSDKPVVELFIMTHCPYGTQAEKGFIPIMKTLGDSVDAQIRFVHYFLHDPEESETPRQICIREEQPTRFLPYLECFLEEGNSDKCISQTSVDKAKMQQCIDNGNADKYYAEDSRLSQAYGVRGSPTLIINGVESSAGRSAASYLSGVCNVFNSAPGSCDKELSSTNPSPGFGYQEGEATTAQC